MFFAGIMSFSQFSGLTLPSNSRDDAAKLKWDGVRCLFEDAQSEILLLIDSCAVRDAPMAGSHGAKQAIAAYTPDQVSLEPAPRSFTASLAETLLRLSTSGRPFSIQQLYDEVRQQSQLESAQALAKLANGSSAKPPPPSHRTPVFFTLTPAKGQGIVLVPLDPTVSQLQSPPNSADAESHHAWRSRIGERGLSPDEVLDLALDEPRVLVCTTFVGEASSDMVFFNQWLNSARASSSKITVEGMFLGPPTMLLISMPTSVWNVVQHDKVCCFLGSINSHNMLHLYQRLVSSHPGGLPDGDGLGFLKRSPSTNRSDNVGIYPTLKGEPPRPLGSHTSQARAAISRASSGHTPPVGPKEEVEDAAEMQEAAEQLKALSHVRAVTDGASGALGRHAMSPGDSIAGGHAGDPGASTGGIDPGMNEASLYDGEYGTPSSKAKPRRPLQKQIMKQEVRCDHCSHAPFKDSSSLRKHIAAAHTRPFPCAFSFAGCTSTFGSKNEWKRHISSQHLCLQFYRCSACPQSSADGKGNEFNRKDLFTQHLRRMHAPLAIKKAISKGDSKLQADWDAHVKDMQTSCLVTRRQPPQHVACPKPGCSSSFEGAGAWDEWTEHVGRHMEKGEAGRLEVDQHLAKWALDEGIIESIGNGEYRLCSGNGSGPGEHHASGNGRVLSESARKTEEDEDPSITVAIPALVAESMDVD
jgi:hypothetical protein